MRKRQLVSTALAIFATLSLPLPVLAHAPSGAIFTTLPDGSEVNANIFDDKNKVYLDGGPGPGAPQTAAGLDDGTYVFQVTDPSGKTLLSEDKAKCRQFTVAGGVITGVVPAGGCEHPTGTDLDHNAKTVKLMPFSNTPNPGGVYKAWATRVEDFLLGCAALGVSNGLEVVDCGGKDGGNAHGFIPSHSKTDNFKVKTPKNIREIDVFFFADTNNNGHFDWGSEERLSGLGVTWTDTLGVNNKKWSYYVPQWGVVEAHVEAVEAGVHKITIENQPGCTVGLVHLGDVDLAVGPQTVTVDMSNISNADKDVSIFIWVACTP
jgi:hypothetical protein